jgi:hypothetical protein
MFHLEPTPRILEPTPEQFLPHYFLQFKQLMDDSEPYEISLVGLQY